MSKRQPSRTTVRLMPPTTSSASSTVGATPRLVSMYAAVRPAGPAPMMTTSCSARGFGLGGGFTHGAPSGKGRRGAVGQLRAPAVYGAHPPPALPPESGACFTGSARAPRCPGTPGSRSRPARRRRARRPPLHLVAVGDHRQRQQERERAPAVALERVEVLGRQSEQQRGRAVERVRRREPADEHDEQHAEHAAQTMWSPEPNRSPPKRSPTASTVRENGILEAAPQRRLVLQRDRLPEVAELRAHPREVRRRPGHRRDHRADRAPCVTAPTPSASRAPPSTAAGITSNTPTGRHSPARKPPTRPTRTGSTAARGTRRRRASSRSPRRSPSPGRRRREQRPEPCGAARRRASPVSRSASRCSSAPNASADTLATTISAAAVWSKRSSRGRGQHRHEREEPQRRLPHRAVPVFGDVAVERGVPREQALTERDRTRRRADLVEQVARERERATTSTRASTHGTTATRRSRRTNVVTGLPDANQLATSTLEVGEAADIPLDDKAI